MVLMRVGIQEILVPIVVHFSWSVVYFPSALACKLWYILRVDLSFSSNFFSFPYMLLSVYPEYLTLLTFFTSCISCWVPVFGLALFLRHLLGLYYFSIIISFKLISRSSVPG